MDQQTSDVPKGAANLAFLSSESSSSISPIKTKQLVSVVHQELPM